MQWYIVVKMTKVHLQAFPSKDLQNILSEKCEAQYNTDCMTVLYGHIETLRQNVNIKPKHVITKCGKYQAGKLNNEIERHNLDFSGCWEWVVTTELFEEKKNDRELARRRVRLCIRRPRVEKKFPAKQTGSVKPPRQQDLSKELKYPKATINFFSPMLSLNGFTLIYLTIPLWCM